MRIALGGVSGVSLGKSSALERCYTDRAEVLHTGGECYTENAGR